MFLCLDCQINSARNHYVPTRYRECASEFPKSLNSSVRRPRTMCPSPERLSLSLPPQPNERTALFVFAARQYSSGVVALLLPSLPVPSHFSFVLREGSTVCGNEFDARLRDMRWNRITALPPLSHLPSFYSTPSVQPATMALMPN